jgi:spore coat polysaccharide biosynthesis protein SpsF
MRTIAVVQARMGSTRLPGKVMRTLCGRTVLGHVIARVRLCSRVDEVVVAIPDAPVDDVLVDEARLHGASAFRGSEEDVLARYYHAAREARADRVVRVTSDCPLFDAAVLCGMLERFDQGLSSGLTADYMSNTLTRSLPRGLDAEIFTFDALERAHQEAVLPFEREHVTPYIYRSPERFSLLGYERTPDLSYLRWTLDTEEDWGLIKAIYDALCASAADFSTADVLALLERRPDLAQLNAHIQQKALSG